MEDFGLNKRFVQFDGLRGWAALIVICSHLCGLNLMPGQGMADGWLMRVWDGTVAVIIFWIMSGFVLSRSIQYAAFKQSGTLENAPRKYILQAYLRRYPRLIIPAVVSCMWMYVLFATGVINFDLSGLPDSEWLRTSAFNFDQRPFDVDNYSLWKGIVSGMTFIKRFVPGFDSTVDMYNPVLWTMKGELLGSFIVFALFLFNRHGMYFIGALLFVAGGIYQAAWLQSFMLGTFLALFMIRRPVFRKGESMALLGISVAILLILRYFTWIDWKMIIAYVIVVLVAFVSFFSAACSTRLSLFLGKVSFPIYLIHFGILFSLGRYVAFLLIPSAGLFAAQWGCLAVTVVLSCFLGVYMEKYIDAPAIRFSKKIASCLCRWGGFLECRRERR